MSTTGISGTSTLDYQMEIQLQKEKEKKAADPVTSEQVQITGLGDTGATSTQTQYSSPPPTKDTIEISKEGRAYQQKSQAASVSESSASVSDSTESEDSSSQNLTSLSEDEIQDLVDKGTISQTEANKELMRRASEEIQNESTENTEFNPVMDEES
jgi:hypothetical protein